MILKIMLKMEGYPKKIWGGKGYPFPPFSRTRQKV